MKIQCTIILKNITKTIIIREMKAVAEHVLINGEQLKHILEKEVKRCERKLLFISAYVTQTAVDWLKRHVPEGIEVHLVCRLTPSDVTEGSTNISALFNALDAGWKVSCLHSLHAKLYSIDAERIYVGSANFTSNGLRIYGTGNMEACSRVPASRENLRFISNIETSANKLNYEILERMEIYIKDKEVGIRFDQWPQDILPNKDGIWVCDFFWSNPQSTTFQENEQQHDLEIVGVESLDPLNKEVPQKVLMSRCVQWFISKLRNQPRAELYFGGITGLLHDELKDDPAPYRKEVKTLVQNLLAYCNIFIPEVVEVSRPNYSQRAKLLVTS